jgi:hypothetical protein
MMNRVRFAKGAAGRRTNASISRRQKYRVSICRKQVDMRCGMLPGLQ